MDYIKLTFILDPVLPTREILYADLDMIGFEAIVDTPNGVEAYIAKENYKGIHLQDLYVSNLDLKVFEYTEEIIAKQNWNQQWEQNFEPIIVNDKCVIRAPFHNIKGYPYDIIIMPKMSFGTGHHQTTFLISNELFELDCTNKSVLDMGCGTGILAIIAAKLGAHDIVAIDIEDWSCENTIDNFEANNLPKPSVIIGDVKSIPNRNFDLILANINRNVLLNDMQYYCNHLTLNGLIIFSGFYETDEALIKECASNLGLEFVHAKHKDAWSMCVFKKK